MKKQYRIHRQYSDRVLNAPIWEVQVKTWIGTWVTIKTFYEPSTNDGKDPDFDYAYFEAQELLEKLQEQ